MPLNLTGCGVISAVSIDMSGPATSPSTAGIGYGMFGYSGVGLGFSSTASGPSQGIAFFTCGDYERMRLTSAGTLMIGASTNNASADISKIAQLIAPRASTSYPLTLSTAGNGCANDEIRMTFNYGVGFSATTYVGSVLENFGTAATGLVFGGYSGGIIERMRITSAGNVGIGTSTPTNALHIYRASGFATMALQVGGNYGYFLANGCCMGIASDAGTTGIKFHINRQAPDDSMLITQAGNVGINCSAPSYKLHVNGTFYAAGSSQDYKQSICNYNTDSCMFMKLKPVTYQYKEEYCHLGKELKSGTQIGLIAEEVAESHPELAILVNEEDNKIVRNVDYEKLSIILLSEVQKLRQEVDDLKNK